MLEINVGHTGPESFLLLRYPQYWGIGAIVAPSVE
jgi:hypothetical protein